MEWANIFLFGLISSIIGAAILLLIQYYAFVKYFNSDDNINEEQGEARNCVLPDNLLFDIHTPSTESKTCTMAINLIFQFLFFELRNTARVRQWFYKKLSVELDQITKTTTGKLLEKLSIIDLDIGHQFPEIRGVQVQKSELHDDGFLEDIEILFNLSYNGNFKLTIDTALGMVGKHARLSLTVKHLSGKMMLKFTRLPYTHWVLSFLDDPIMDLDINCQVPTKQMQSNITALIVNQIKKAVKKKHTLPNYKIRYKPFFHHVEEDFSANQDLQLSQFNRKVEVNIIEVTRVYFPSKFKSIYCTLTMSPIPFTTIKNINEYCVLVEADIEIIKAKNQQIGIVFKQEKEEIIIDGILPNTPASKVDLQKGDILLKIEGKCMINLNQVAKMLKNFNKPVLLIKIAKKVTGTIIVDGFENETKNLAKTPQNSSIDNLSDINDTSSPTNSPKKTGLAILKSMKSKLIRTTSDIKVQDEQVLLLNQQNTQKADYVENKDSPSYTFYKYITKNYEVSDFIWINELCTFTLQNNENYYFNFNIFGIKDNNQTTTEQLLGYVNFPIGTFSENEHLKINQMKQFNLLSAELPNFSNLSVSGQSGFDPYLCNGDVRFSFKNIPKRNSSSTAGQTAEKNEKVKHLENEKEHDFVRTHFHRITACDFCGKKIWLKDALQCQECGMKIHRKCMEKCNTSSKCKVETAKIEFQLTKSDELTDNIDNPPYGERDIKRRKSSQFLNIGDALNQSLKRVNSTSNLSLLPLALSFSANSKSLPPSPQRSPRNSEALSPSNPFERVLVDLEKYIETPQMTIVDEIISHLKFIGNHDELIDTAKEYGKSIYLDMQPKNRRITQINLLINQVHQLLDVETQKQIDSEAIANQENALKKSRLDENSLICFERIEYLNVIILFLCTGLQNAQTD